MLEVTNLRKEFGDVVAVEKLNFTVGSGQIMGLIGQNGSGKTTTFRMLLNHLVPDQGEIQWGLKAFQQGNFNALGYLPEERGLNQKATVENQILYFAELHGKRRRDIRPKIDDWMDKFQVKGKKSDKIKSLSKGNQQKVQLITTLIHEPEFIILDEPFSGLDPVNAELLEAGILEAKEAGASIIFSSHNMNNVENLCQYIVMLKQGKQVLSGGVRNIREYFGRTRLEIESPLGEEDFRRIQGVEEITPMGGQRYTLKLENADVGREIFRLATRQGYIPIFSQTPPNLEEIFKWIAGEGHA